MLNGFLIFPKKRIHEFMNGRSTGFLEEYSNQEGIDFVFIYEAFQEKHYSFLVVTRVKKL
jgi:hypothetical protein